MRVHGLNRRSARLSGVASGVALASLLVGALGPAASATDGPSAALPAGTTVPVVSSVSALPHRLSYAGGNVVIRADVRHATTCEITASPSLHGYPVTVGCRSGHVRELATLRRNRSHKSVSEKFRVEAVTGSHRATRQAEVTEDAPFGWETAVAAQDGLGFSDVSCASPSFCEAVDNGGNAVTWNGANWSEVAQAEADPPPEGALGGQVSCPTTAFCGLLDNNGDWATFDGTSWSEMSAAAVDLVGPGLSCAASDLCVAASSGQVASFDGTTWTAPESLFTYDADAPVGAVSCVAGSSFCMAVYDAQFAIYSGSAWSVPSALPSPDASAVSCLLAESCVATTSSTTYLWNGAIWTGIAVPTDISDLNCSSDVSCVALGNWTVVSFDGTQWTEIGTGISPLADHPNDGSLTLSCPTATFCAEAGGNQALVFDPTNWPTDTDPSSISTPSGSSLNDVACVGQSWCVAVNLNGYVETWADGQWSVPAPVAPGVNLTGVSCASVTSCMSVAANGSAYEFDGLSWSATSVPDGGNYLSSVSCATEDSCVAVDSTDDFYSWDGSSSVWTSLGAGTVPGSPVSISCATSGFCVAVGRFGWETTDTGGSLASSQIDPDPDAPGASGPNILAVACPSVEVCVATDAAGQQMTWNGSSWTAPAQLDEYSISLFVSCSSASACLATDGEDSYSFNGTFWTTDPLSTSGVSIVGLSCVSSTLCISVGQYGVSEFDGTTWGPEADIVDNDLGLVALSCPQTSFCVGADSAGYGYIWDGSSWSLPFRLLVEQAATFGTASLSCVSETFCVEIAGSQADMWNGVTWTIVNLASGSQLSGISCTSATFCLASSIGMTIGSVSTENAIFLWNGHDWRAGPGYRWPGPVSCTSSTFCASAIGYIFNGSNWSAPLGASGVGGYDVSCSSSTFCMADSKGTYWLWNGVGWTQGLTAPSRIGGTAGALDCLSSVLCAANGIVWDGEAWSSAPAAAPVDDEGLFSGPVSCTSPTWCMVTGGTTSAILDPSRMIWPKVADPSGTLSAISCWDPGDCVAVNDAGFAYQSSDGTWSEPVLADSAMGDLSALSCPASGVCFAVDTLGYVFKLSGGKWAAGPKIDPGPFDVSGLIWLSCASTTFCLAGDGDGNVFEMRGSSWTPITSFSNSLWAVSCASATFCMGANGHNQLVEFNGTSSVVTGSLLAGGGGSLSLSCTSAEFCAAVSASEGATVWDGTSWSSPVNVEGDGDGAITSVSCVGPSFCTLVDSAGRDSVYNGISWSAPAPISAGKAPDLIAVSCSSETNCAAISASNEVYSGGSSS